MSKALQSSMHVMHAKTAKTIILNCFLVTMVCPKSAVTSCATTVCPSPRALEGDLSGDSAYSEPTKLRESALTICIYL